MQYNGDIPGVTPRRKAKPLSTPDTPTASGTTSPYSQEQPTQPNAPSKTGLTLPAIVKETNLTSINGSVLRLLGVMYNNPGNPCIASSIPPISARCWRSPFQPRFYRTAPKSGFPVPLVLSANSRTSCYTCGPRFSRWRGPHTTSYEWKES